MISKYNAQVVLATALLYVALFKLNDVLFSSFSYSTGVDWIYLPSGLRLAFILIFGIWGAIGIGLSTVAISLNFNFFGDYVPAIVTGLISGFSPLLARKLCVDFMGLNVGLEQLSPSKLLKVAAVFAIVSPVMHQLWYVWLGKTENLLSSTAVMAVGDLMGTIAVLYIARFAFKALD